MSRKTKLASIGIIRPPRIPNALADDRILVSQRIAPDRPEEHMKWQLAGGSIEFGEHPIDALIREIVEEVGITPGVENMDHPNVLSVVAFGSAEPGGPGHIGSWNLQPDEDVHGIMIIYECRAISLELPPNPEPDEHTDWEWVSLPVMRDRDKFLAFDMLFEQGYFDR